MNGKEALGLVGFVVLGLSPSYEDWRQSPQDRKSMVIFYVVAIGLIYYGVFSPSGPP